jgi:hypothetical protein
MMIIQQFVIVNASATAIVELYDTNNTKYYMDQN